MLPLSGSDLPRSASDLATALRDGLANLGFLPRALEATGDWPRLARLKLDLTGGEISQRLSLSKATGSHVAEFVADSFEFVAAPATVFDTPVHTSVTASAARFAICPGETGNHVALLRHADHGRIEVEVAREALEKLVQKLATDAAKAHGVEIKGTALRIESRGPRALSVAAEVTAKMFVATATVTLSGDLDLDDHLNARLSNLQFSGSGMIANVAAGFIRPQLARLEGQTFSLLSFAVGEVRLRDVQLEVGSTLRVRAEFGS